jgi:membrane-bound metal-dependent hydrolase YbcI (DUF457 family)
MDILTHLLSGYLVSYWASLSSTSGSPNDLYVIFGTFMAVAPDIDVFLKPIWARQPHTGHHGITHMFIFIIIVPTIIYVTLTMLLDFSDPRLLLLMYLTGSMHLLWDFVGTGGVRPFYPYQKKYYKLNLEVGANPLLGIYSLLSLLFLLAIYFKLIEFVDFQSVTFLVGAGYLLDLGLRAALKSYYSRRPENKDFTALPTLVPYRWRFAKRKETEDGIEVVLKTHNGLRKYSIPRARLQRVESCQDLTSTYWLHQVQERLRIFDYPYYRIDCGGDKREITWNAAEMGRVMDVKVTCNVDLFVVSTEFRRSLKNYWDDLAG